MGHSPITVVSGSDDATAEALLKLMKVCFDSMSYESRWGHKGRLHQHLKKYLEGQLLEKESLSEEKIKQYISDLFRISFCYRPTSLGLFQASYANSNTGRKVIRVMKDESVNTQLPLAEVLLGDEEADLSTMSDVEIVNAALRLRESEDWAFASNEIKEESFRCLAP